MFMRVEPIVSVLHLACSAMSQSTTEQKLKDIERFLSDLSRNEALAKSSDHSVRDICAKAKDLDDELRYAIVEVHRHWERK